MPTEFQPSGDEQQQIIQTDAPLTVVLGGAGTGKTTCASAAAHKYLEHRARTTADRVLFLSFSRSSVSRIADRAHNILGPHSERVDITTFHALAWGIVNRFGSIIGHPSPTLASPAYHRINTTADALEYDDLIPNALQILRTSTAVKGHVQSRWGLVIADEFQDTDDLQAELLDQVSTGSRVILLGDANQCIYTFRRADGVRVERIADACTEAGPDNTILLPDVSYRDPTGLIPSVATAIMRRDFGSPAVMRAIQEDRLIVHTDVAPHFEVSSVADIVQDLQQQGLGVAVFSHHNDMLAALSDGLRDHDITHEIAGLDDADSAALTAQVEMLRYAAGDTEWSAVLSALAVFVASAVRGKGIPQLARSLRTGNGSGDLQAALTGLRSRLDGNTMSEALTTAADAHGHLSLPSKSTAWKVGTALLAPMAARAVRELGRKVTDSLVAAQVVRDARDATHQMLTGVRDDPSEVQLMNLYQTKGREADATVVVLRANDYFGNEGEPFPDTSRLLYVVFSRAKKKIVVVLVGSSLPAAIAPLARLATRV